MIDTDLLTNDTLFSGQLKCNQFRDGYRFSIDSVLLAHFREKWGRARVLDIGCGCGVLGLILLYRFRNIEKCVGLEIQESLVELTRHNIRINSLEDRYEVTQGDYCSLSSLFRAEHFSHVICNPPFYRKNSGRTSLNKQEYMARHQLENDIPNLAKSLFYVLRNKGVARLIYPADRLSELFYSLIKHRMQPKFARLVYSYPEAEQAKLILVEAIKNGNEGIKVLAPLYIYTTKNGPYSHEVDTMYNG